MLPENKYEYDGIIHKVRFMEGTMDAYFTLKTERSECVNAIFRTGFEMVGFEPGDAVTVTIASRQPGLPDPEDLPLATSYAKNFPVVAVVESIVGRKRAPDRICYCDELESSTDFVM